MLLKNKKSLLLFLFIVLFCSCKERKVLYLSKEELENCAKWNWIALSDTSLWSPKGEAYFTYVPNMTTNKFIDLTKEELLLCGTWESIYASSYFYNITEKYKNQYENSKIVGKIYFCRDGSGFLENRLLLNPEKVYITYKFRFSWKIENNNIFVRPVSIEEQSIDNNDVIERNEFSDNSYYKIGRLTVDDKYLIQLTNWDFSKIPINGSFLKKKYGVSNLGIDCLRYKYTWIEDWGEPILEDFVIYNTKFSLNDLKSIKLYKLRSK